MVKRLVELRKHYPELEGQEEYKDGVYLYRTPEFTLSYFPEVEYWQMSANGVHCQALTIRKAKKALKSSIRLQEKRNGLHWNLRANCQTRTEN